MTYPYRSMTPAALAMVLALLAGPAWPAESTTSPAAEAGGASDEGISLGPIGVSLFGEYTYRSTDFSRSAGPGSGVQGYTTLRLSAWPWAAGGGRLQVYADLVPALGTRHEFSWQRYGQLDLGVHWLPLLGRQGAPGPAQGLRLFVQVMARGYYDQPEGADRPGADLWLGADFYWDDLLDRRRWGVSVYTSATLRATNFTLDEYRTLLWEGSLDAGPKLELAEGLWMPYAVAEWAYNPRHPELWWENYLRLGLGLRWFPSGRSTAGSGGWGRSFRQRLQLFAEAVHRVAWIGDRPEIGIADTDVRFGIAFATGGVWGHRPRNWQR